MAEAVVKEPTAKHVHFPFWFGGSAWQRSLLIPLIWVRLQSVSSAGKKSMMDTFLKIIQTEGISGLYAGLSAALLRQMTYSTVRFGVYEELKSHLKASEAETSSSKVVLIPLSAISGAMGGVAGNPADIVNVRMQSDSSKPLNERLNYKNGFAGIIHVIRHEGTKGLFRGVGANSMRAVLMNTSQLASYDIFKDFCLKSLSMSNDGKTYSVASLFAGLTATTICSPVDVVKTRIMNSTTKPSVIDLVKHATLREGPFWIFKGWFPSFIRLGPQTILTMLFLEQHRVLYMKVRDF